jgi:ribosomal protein S6--L-glutamate ligase
LIVASSSWGKFERVVNGQQNPITEVWLLTDTRYLRQRMPAALARWLAGEGTPPKLVVADRDDPVNESSEDDSSEDPPWSGLRRGDLVVTRSRHPLALELLERAETFGARPLDSAAAVAQVRDKLRCWAALERRDLPVPQTFVGRRPVDFEKLAADAFPLLLKPVLGDNARGLRLVTRPDELAAVEWPEDIVLAQSFLDAGGIDLKVYVAGEAIWAVRRASPLTDAQDVPRRAEVTHAVRELANACRDEFGLVLFGLDVLELADGALAIVDVNEFPNYTGIEEAPAAIGRLVLEEAARRPRRAARQLVGRT